MTLTLSMLRTPAGVGPETRRFQGGTVVLGRGTDSDWVLPDPERLLSKRHCALITDEGVWRVVDSSSNGTFLNGRCLDPGAPMPLRHGDRLGLAAYEVEIGIEEGDFEHYGRVTADPFPEAGTHVGGLALPHDFNALGQDGLFGDVTEADGTPDLAGHFEPPRTQGALLPPDWDSEDEGLEARDVGALPIPVTGRVARPEPPLTSTGEDAADWPVRLAQVAEAGGPDQSSYVSPDGDLAAAFALVGQAAGIQGTPRVPPSEALAALGRAFRATVTGLRRMMIARAAVKTGFRIEQTMMHPDGNNPLKFSASDDDALAALLGIGRTTGISASQAVIDAFRDMRLHDLAVTVAMQRAARDMLDRLHPCRAEEELPKSPLDVLPGQRARRGFAAAVARHEKITRAFSDDFDSVFGRAFVRAYEQAQAELSAQEPAGASDGGRQADGGERRP